MMEPAAYDELHRRIEDILAPHGITSAPGETRKGPFTGPGWVLFDGTGPFLMLRQAIPLRLRPEIPKDETGSSSARPMDEAAELMTRMTYIGDLLNHAGMRTEMRFAENDSPMLFLSTTPALPN